MDPKSEQPYRQRLQARLIDIAERMLEAEGLAGVQARRVTAEADCSVGTLYNIFGGLDGLILAVNAQSLHRLGDSLATALRGAGRGTLEDRLLALALAYRDFAVSHNNRWRALFEHRMANGEAVPETYRERSGDLFVLVEACIETVVPDRDERAMAARALFSAVHGIVALAMEARLGNYDEADMERQIRFIVANSARGLQAGR